MEIVALYASPDSLSAALAAGARHLAATVGGLALVYRTGSTGGEPDGWAGFTCAQDAQGAGEHLDEFRRQVTVAQGPITIEAPAEPSRIWARAAGGLYGFALRYAGRLVGVALVGCPGAWPRMRKAEVDSILAQLALILDHNQACTSNGASEEPPDEVLRMSEQLFEQDIELIRKNERIGEVEQLHNDLMVKTAREFRRPLNGILERLVGVLSSEHDSLGEAARVALREALADGNGMLRTFQNLQDLWRAKQGDVRVELQDVNLAEVVEEAIFDVRDRLRSGVEMCRRLPPQLPKVRTDLAKLTQIMVLMLDNAVKFTHRGRIELQVSLEEGALCVSVSDTGIGISTEDREQIFEEFFQVDPGDDGRYAGAGLGLALTRALVEQLGGSIQVTSEIARGSRFSVLLPIQPA